MGVHVLQVTLGATATRISSTRIPVRQVTFQNNAANTMRIGDSTVSSTKGIQLAFGNPGGSATMGTLDAYNTDLSEWWVFGTNAQLLDVLYIA